MGVNLPVFLISALQGKKYRHSLDNRTGANWSGSGHAGEERSSRLPEIKPRSFNPQPTKITNFLGFISS